MPLIRQLQASGIKTVPALAAELNARGVRTPASAERFGLPGPPWQTVGVLPHPG